MTEGNTNISDNRINDNNQDSTSNNNNISNVNNNANNNGSSNSTTNSHPQRHSILKLHIPEPIPQKPIDESKNHVKPKKKRRDKSDLGDNFVAPDGGWGWLVAIAGGVNILVTFAVAQQFGIIFRERMSILGISSSELTTIINTQVAISAFTGLLNGPLFRRYTFRVVAVVGSVLTFLGLFLSVFAASFMFYIFAFSCLYGFGRGLTVSASSLAVNTYFKQKRRTATAYQFGVAGMGPIVLPYFATYMLQVFGVQGTVLVFSAISLHTIACSLIYQPVKWHVKKLDKDAEALNQPHDDHDEMHHVVEPETPTLPRANDGWFGSRNSLNVPTYRSRRGTLDGISPTYRSRRGTLETDASTQMVELKRLNSKDYDKKRSISVSYSIKEEEHEHSDTSSLKMAYVRKKSVEEVLKTPTADLHALDEEERKSLPFYKKIIIFFDLDLLRDFTYLNLAVGLTLINFVEINFAILTPFILSDFGFENHQIALAMSALGFCDLVVRFLVPVLTARFNFSNKTFFIVGILGMCIGRFIVSITRNFYIMLGAFLWMGLNKAFRTVFWSLIIPGYVPLKRLPAAAGLQLLMSGVFSMACGPLIGLIRDYTNYAFTLNFLNILCILACLMWILEAMWRKRQNKGKPVPTSDDQ